MPVQRVPQRCRVCTVQCGQGQAGEGKGSPGVPGWLPVRAPVAVFSSAVAAGGGLISEGWSIGGDLKVGGGGGGGGGGDGAGDDGQAAGGPEEVLQLAVDEEEEDEEEEEGEGEEEEGGGSGGKGSEAGEEEEEDYVDPTAPFYCAEIVSEGLMEGFAVPREVLMGGRGDSREGWVCA